MRRYVLPLFISNSIALVTIALSYLLYSRLLSAQQFGVYAAALAVGNFATLVLDGGVKVSLIKSATAPTRGEECALLHLMCGFSIVLLVALMCFRGVIAHFFPALKDQTDFVASFAGVYLLSYPWIGLSTAQLERRLEYSRLAWIESTGLILERGLPAAILSFTRLGLYAFVVGLLLGRVLRLVTLARSHSIPFFVRNQAAGSYRSVLNYLREGSWYQLGLGSSLVRDNLHILMIGPIYGAAWVGYYAWGLQLCMIASQVFVQISARISVPITAQTSEFSSRWQTIVRQIGLLTALTAPILAAAMLVAPSAIRELFNDKWKPALVLLPYLFARMLPGAATAPISALVLVERGARRYAAAVWLWTLVEIGLGLTAIRLLGKDGLAVSYAVAAWIGALFLLGGLNRGTGKLIASTLSAIFLRPSLWASLIVGAPCALAVVSGRALFSTASLSVIMVVGMALVLAFYAIDSDLRSMILRSKS